MGLGSPQVEKQAKLKRGGVKMADEIKKEEQKAEPSKLPGTILKVLIGLALLLLGVLAIIRWWADLLMIIKGCIGLFMILAGVITLAIAKE